METFNKKFRIEELLIKNSGTWKISLRPAQVTIGSLVLSLTRKCTELSELTREEAQDLQFAFKDVHDLLNKTLQPDKINYLALMMVDYQVHFHVIPRYENNREFNGELYADENWPNPPDVVKTIPFSEEALFALKNEFQL